MGNNNISLQLKDKVAAEQSTKYDNLEENQASFLETEDKMRAFRFNNDLYVEQKKLGDGCYSDVFLYKNTTQDSLHALKILKDNTTTEAFRQELKIMKDVESQFVIKMEDFIKIDDQLCIIMEYANQGTLESFIQNISNQTVSISPSQILDLVCDIFSGLDVLHSKKIIHRDLKMDNLLVCNYQIKIADLGVATYLITKSYAQTKVGNMLYAAPEKINEEDTYNSASDIYSAGLIILKMFLGLPDSEIIKMKLNNNFTKQINDSPENLRIFFQRLLDKNPQSRPSAINALNLVKELKQDSEVLDYINKKMNGVVIETVQTLFQKGMQYFWDSNFESAEQCFSKILEKDPVSIEGLGGKILCYNQYRRWINKCKLYNKDWIKDQIKQIQELNPYHQMCFLCEGIINKDLDSISKYLLLNPSKAEVYAFKGDLLKNKNLEEAIELGQKALDMNESSAYVLRMLGNIYSKSNSETSNQFYEKSLLINPNQFIVIYNLGIGFQENNQIDKALEYFDKALTIYPYHKWALEDKFLLMSEEKEQYKEVIDQIQQLFKEYGEQEDFYYCLAYSFDCLEDLSNAILYYKKYLTIHPNNSQAIINISDVYLRQNEYKKAQEYYQLGIDKKIKNSYIKMFELLRDQLNQSGKAIAYLRQASELEYDIKDDYDCYVKLFIHSQLEQMKKWLQFSELALKEHPSSKLISDEILCLLSNEYFEEDLPSQFKLAQLIESFQGISEESTLCKLKCSINKKDLMISHILKYFEDTIHKEQNMEEYFTQLLKFKLYIDQNNLQNLYQGVFKMSLSNPTNLNCVVLFISLITLVERKFSKNMLEEMEKVCLKNKVFENHHDQQLISFIRFFFMTYKLGYFLKWREPKETDELFVEYMQTVIKVDAASKKRFYQYPYSMCLSVNLILNEKNKLGYSSQEQDALKRFLKEFRKDGAKLHPDLAQTFNQFQ